MKYGEDKILDEVKKYIGGTYDQHYSTTKDGVETYMVDANYTDSDTTKYMGRVVYDTDTFDQSLEDAKENGDVTIDTWVEEKEVMTEKEKDENAGVVRDKDGNVMSEATSG